MERQRGCLVCPQSESGGVAAAGFASERGEHGVQYEQWPFFCFSRSFPAISLPRFHGGSVHAPAALCPLPQVLELPSSLRGAELSVRCQFSSENYRRHGPCHAPTLNLYTQCARIAYCDGPGAVATYLTMSNIPVRIYTCSFLAFFCQVAPQSVRPAACAAKGKAARARTSQFCGAIHSALWLRRSGIPVSSHTRGGGYYVGCLSSFLGATPYVKH